MHVLILDDDANNRLTLSALFEHEGMKVQAVDTLAALRAALRASPFDVAVLDLHVEDGLGTDVVPELVERGSRVILMSGTAEPGLKIRGVECAFRKGDAFDVLLAAVRGASMR